MATHVALLRGINVGGKNKVAMADLREVVADTSALATALATAITDRLGVSAPVVVLSRDELAEAIAANPFPAEPDPKRVHAVLLSRAPAAEAAGKIDAAL